MKRSGTLVALSWVVAILAGAAAAAGLLTGEGPAPFPYTTVRGETATAFGDGLYRYDSLFTGAANRGTDAMTLAVSIPLLLASLLLYRRGSRAGGLLLSGALAYFLYLYATMALGAAYNALFLLYVAIFAASLFAFVLAFDAVRPLAAEFSDRLPRRGIAAFLFASGALTLAVWLEAPLASIATGRPPALLGGSTTLVTHALDLAVIVPAVFLAGALLLRRDARGYVVAFPLVVLVVLLVPVIAAQTVSQLAAGIVFTTPEIVGPIGGFLVLGTAGVWVLVRLLRDLAVPPRVASPPAAARLRIPTISR